MLRHKHMHLYMFIGMFIIQYFVFSYIMSNRVEHITNSVGKVYMCTLMGLFMVFLDILLADKFNAQYFAIVVGLILLFIYLYKTQFGVDDKNYLQEMIEHHSMALLTSKQILEKTKNPGVNNFAVKILLNQEKEIEDMRYLLKSIWEDPHICEFDFHAPIFYRVDLKQTIRCVDYNFVWDNADNYRITLNHSFFCYPHAYILPFPPQKRQFALYISL